MCGPLFEEELQYWGLDASDTEPCCWMQLLHAKFVKLSFVTGYGKTYRNGTEKNLLHFDCIFRFGTEPFLRKEILTQNFIS